MRYEKWHNANLAGSETYEVTPKRSSQAFSNLFNAYGKFFNRQHARTGKLFEERFHRIHVQTESYFMQLVAYVHLNPQAHGFVDDFRAWVWSSYAAFLSDKPTKLNKDEVLSWFGGLERFKRFHTDALNEPIFRALRNEDLD